MPAWIYVVAVAAVLTVAWYGWARRWLHAWRYSWARAAHAVDLTLTEAIPGAEFGSMDYHAERALWTPPAYLLAAPVDPEPWRQRITAELSPEALDGGPTVSGPEGAMGVNAPTVQLDPGAGDVDVVSSAPAPVLDPDWLETQMSYLFAWVRSVHAMEVPA